MLKAFFDALFCVTLPKLIGSHVIQVNFVTILSTDDDTTAVGHGKPNVFEWISDILKELLDLKLNGIVVNIPDSSGHVSPIHFEIIFLGIVGDLPALAMMLNFKGHNGYYACFFCLTRGVYDTKVLYPFTRPLVERSSDDFKRFALEGSPQNDCFGHYGMSVISELYDHDLPSAIMIDYLHTSLLRQTKTIITHLRELLSISEIERLDTLLKHQSFPHTFNRRLPSFLNLAYVKGSELRNLLLYAMIPRLIDFFDIELVSFLCLFVCGVRLLHGSPVVAVDRCIRQQLSSQLFDDYQRNVSQYFNKINTLTCHLHDHY
ncbi:unnamed protein product, partial [Didymodactylos carnosus]